MKKLVISLALALLLIAAVAIPVMADDITASVTVTEYSSVTITDNGAAGLAFGSLNPGTVKQAETDTPSVTVTAAAENNTDVDIKISGTDFDDGGSNNFAIANAFWNDANDAGTATEMKKTGVSTDTVATLSANESVDIYHWISVPATQEAATYSSTFTYVSE
jgi:hypothetical protein